MIYSFRCDGCAHEVDLDRPMDQAGEPAHCEMCTAPMRRLFNSHSICDEIRGTNYLDPRINKRVKDHGKYYDIGMGRWIRSKSERRALMKRDGLVEVGSTQV
jgi:predicted nucleic acid-binding Zn ribbon protein